MKTIFFITIGTLIVACSSPNEDESPAAQQPDILKSSATDCAQVSIPCLQSDFSNQGQIISRDLFGDGVEWTTYGNNIMKPDATNNTSGNFIPEVMSALKDMNFTVMRYPGGTLADLFHWQQAIGPMSSRSPQPTLFPDSSGGLYKDIPNFGPDEFASFAQQLGTEILLTVNVGTGTAQEAAGWVSYWKGKGVKVKYVEIGNEMYLEGPGGSFPVMDPVDYAQKYNAYAAAIRAVDSTIKIGAIGISDTTFWCTPACTSNPWNQMVLKNITQKIDFFAVHHAYAPGTSATDTNAFDGMLGYSEFLKTINSAIKADIEMWATTTNKNVDLAVTETASYFLPPTSGDLDTIFNAVTKNQSLAAALYSATVLNVFIRDPRISLVTHINPLHYLWQAPVTLAQPDYSKYPYVYDPKPTVSAYGLIFKSYRETAGANLVAVNSVRIPTESKPATTWSPPQTDVPVLESISAKSGTRGWQFVINRSLTKNVEAQLVFKNIPEGATTITVDQISSPDYKTRNIPETDPQAIRYVTLFKKRLPSQKDLGINIEIPKHTFLRVRIE